MTHYLIQYLEQMVEIAKVWGPLLIFIFMTIESSMIPFPSEIIMIPAGFMAARGELPPGPVATAMALAIFLGFLGSLCGAWINYFIALKLGRPLLHKYGKWLFLKPEALDRAEELFREYGDVTTLVCRLLPAIRQLISLPAGISKMNFFRFSFFTGLGAGIWVCVLTFMGYYFGKKSGDMSYEELVHTSKDLIKHNLIWIALGCVVVFATYVWIHKKIMHGNKTEAA